MSSLNTEIYVNEYDQRITYKPAVILPFNQLKPNFALLYSYFSFTSGQEYPEQLR